MTDPFPDPMNARSLPNWSRCPGTLAVAVPGLVEYQAELVLPLASVGKLLLLVEVARRIAYGTLDAAEPVDLVDEDICGGSGLLSRLAERSGTRGLPGSSGSSEWYGSSGRRWTVGELAVLTAAVSDNTATNALLRRLGTAAVNAGAADLGLVETRILDRIREPRLPEHAPTFAIGTARELAGLAARIAEPSDADQPWARLVLGWLAANTDRSMVPALIPHDPEDDRVPDGLLPASDSVLWVADKTGTDAGIRSDVGIVIGTARRVGYAVLATCQAGHEFEMLQAVRTVGPLVAKYAAGD